MAEGNAMKRSIRLRPIAFIALFLAGLVYVSQYFSPSSYAVVLRELAVLDVGLVWGQPRPIRSDEWAVVTPLTQAAVHNDFGRVNETSYYKEDLRINYGLPIRDWGLVFKPTMWAYFIVDAAHAYSFHWFAVFGMFLVGHALLFRRLGFGDLEAGLLAMAVYFTGFTQFWWNEKGPVFAFFPWIVVALLSKKAWPLRLLLFYWLAVSWLITNFYPPLFISLAFVAALLLLAFGRDWLKPGRLAALLFATACAGATAALYLKDYLLKTAATTYPGHRSLSGGSVPWSEWWSQLFPFNGFDWRYNSVVDGQNICEVGAFGAAFALMYLCFMDYRKLPALIRTASAARTQLRMLACGLALMYAWMLLPLPSWTGAVFLWNHVQPERMEYAAGLLMLVIVALAGRSTGLVVTAPRATVYAAAVFLGWIWFKDIGGLALVDSAAVARRSNDLLILPVLLACLVGGRWMRLPVSTVLMGASAFTGTVLLFGFNPIQSAKPIFARHDTPAIRAIESEVASDGTLAMAGLPGAVLNGLGYASVSHVTAVPALAHWRARYPEMPEAEFLGTFNRYSHIRLSGVEKPMSPQADVVEVPLRDFWPNRVDVPAGGSGIVPVWLTPGLRAEGHFSLPRAGAVDTVQVSIGTGAGSADGVLHLRICETVSNICANGQRELREAADNAYFPLRLDRPLRALGNGTDLSYVLWTEQARTPVALLTQRVGAEPDSSLLLDGVLGGSAPRFRIDLKSVDR